MDQKYEALFTPWKIGNVEIKNRIVMCPMGGTSLFGWFELTGCGFDKEAAKLFLERAQNNVGLIIPGIAPLRDTFWGKWLWQNPKMFEELKVFMDEIHSGIHNVTTFVMLCVAPLNVVKGAMVSVLTLLLYKRVARPLFGIHK